MNDTQITFCGWVGTEVTLKDLGQGVQVASFRVASTPRRFRNGQWEDGPTLWYTVKAWRALATHLHRSIRSGDPVLVHGRLMADVWRREDGTVSTRYVVVASSVGHDLSRGTSAFTRLTRREEQRGPDVSRVQEPVHHSDDGSGPRPDADGEMVPKVAELPAEEPAA
ncbi:MAG TPA: single-stranded DNA-binding protein [Nocardioides sp.]|uniref:single-stranded DNA-binding protein n=1 Tax=Nocardioides sp. TaxID=35761 RepID=UPI002CF74BD8|nr:single-stranded DNA-binding protein [Nocardioides sp.]HQR25751.1 single-stranded DNA-binding protein [Nocardioides sp.]